MARGLQTQISFTTTTDAHSAGDVVAVMTEIPNWSRLAGHASRLTNIELHNQSDLAVALDLVFGRSQIAIGNESAAYAPADAASLGIAHTLNVLATDYDDQANNQSAFLSGLDIWMAPTAGTSLWVAVVARGSIQLGGTAVLHLGLGYELGD